MFRWHNRVHERILTLISVTLVNAGKRNFLPVKKDARAMIGVAMDRDGIAFSRSVSVFVRLNDSTQS